MILLVFIDITLLYYEVNIRLSRIQYLVAGLLPISLVHMDIVIDI